MTYICRSTFIAFLVVWLVNWFPFSQVLTAQAHKWRVVHSDARATFDQIQFIDAQVGWATTNHQLWRTQNGGTNWLPVRSAVSRLTPFGTSYEPTMRRIQFSDRSTGWLLEGSSLLHTADAGVSWKVTHWDAFVPLSFAFRDPREGYVVGETLGDAVSGKDEPRRGLMYRTLNGGETWQPIEVRVGLNYDWVLRDVFPISPQNLIVVGTTSYLSRDGGLMWNEISFPPSHLVHGVPSITAFANRLVGWVITNQPGGYYATSDAGRAWQAISPPQGVTQFEDLVYLNDQEVWAVAGAVYYSADSGNTWQLELKGDFHSLQYLSKDHSLRVAGEGVLAVCELQ